MTGGIYNGGVSPEVGSPASWEPPWGPSRAAGGLLGVMGGESDTWLAPSASPGSGEVRQQGPVAEALMDIAHGYVQQFGVGLPVKAAARHEGLGSPAWLLSVAVVRPQAADQVADTLELATAAGVPRRSLGACVAYVELAAALFAGHSIEQVIGAAGDRVGTFDLAVVADPQRPTPPLCGEGMADALTAGAWALCQDGPTGEVVAAVGATATPGVGAAVAGLLGLRDGCGALPHTWHEGDEQASVCAALVPDLVRSRCNGTATRPGRSRLTRRWGRRHSWKVPSTQERSHVPATDGEVRNAAAYAVTEELEAIEEQVPDTTAGVGVTVGSASEERPGRWLFPWRELEGAAQR